MVVVASVVSAVVVTTVVAAVMAVSPTALMHAVVVIPPVVVVLRENADPAGQDEYEHEKRAEFFHLRILLPSGVWAMSSVVRGCGQCSTGASYLQPPPVGLLTSRQRDEPAE
jgi:hypothetical protein